MSKHEIVQDGAGWNGQHARLTCTPCRDTLVCQPWMSLAVWELKVKEWLTKHEDGVLGVRAKVRLPNRGDGNAPNGPRVLDVTGTVLEIRGGNLAMIRWDAGPGLRYCGVGGGWYAIEELEEVTDGQES